MKVSNLSQSFRGFIVAPNNFLRGSYCIIGNNDAYNAHADDIVRVVGSNTFSQNSFAAVAGTGWTDISKLQSTCSAPGYFVNQQDCGKFYCCVDQSTPDHSLLLRYDFECPEGLAFDESTKNCNYPGPSGCVDNSGWNRPDPGSGWNKPNPGSGWNKPDPGSGWNKPDPGSGWNKPDPGSGWNKPDPGSGWNKPDPGSGWNKPDPGSGWNKPDPGSGWNKPDPGSGWNKPDPGSGWNKPDPGSGWNKPDPGSGWNKPDPGSGWNKPDPGSGWNKPDPGSGWNKPAPGSGWNKPAPGGWGWNSVWQGTVTNSWGTQHRGPGVPTTIIRVPTAGPSRGTVIRVPSSGPQPSNPVVNLPSHTILQVPQGEWESLRLHPKSGPRVTPVPQVEWETAPAFPVVNQNVQQVEVQKPPQVWSSVRITPTPTPAPAVPNTRVVYTTVTQPPQAVAWHGARISPSPVPFNPSIDQNTRYAQVVQTPSVDWQQTPAVEWQNSRLATVQQQQQQRVVWNAPTAANPSLNVLQTGPTPPSNVHVIHGNAGQPANPLPALSNPSINIPAGGNGRIIHLPSGYIWHSSSIPNGNAHSFPIAASSPAPALGSVGLASSASKIASNGDFGIVQQVIDESDGQSAVSEKPHIQLVYENKEKQQIVQEQTTAALAPNQPPRELDSFGPSNPIYEFVAPPESGIKGRIIVLYAPLNSKGEKREAPVIEVEVEQADDDDEDESEGNDDSKNSQ